MTKKLTLKDFEHLAEILEKNKNAKIPDSHWKGVHEMVRRNAIEFARQEKAMTPTWEDMNRRFDL